MRVYGRRWEGEGDRPFSSVMRSARWRALRGALNGDGEGRKGGGGGGGTLSWRSGLCRMLGVWLVFLDLEDGSARVLKVLGLDRAEEDQLACGEDVEFLFTAPLAALERRDIVGRGAGYSWVRDGDIREPAW